MGKMWKVLFVPLKGVCGWCYHDEKTILIDADLEGRELMYVTIHEVLHACKWSKKEYEVEGAARAITRVVWRFQRGRLVR